MPAATRIAFVITELEVGGAERCLVNLVTGMDRTRYAPMVCSLAPRPAAGRDELVRRLENAAIPVHFLGLRSSTRVVSGWFKLKRLLRQYHPDVVQTFLFHANVLGAFAAQAAGVPYIVSGIRVADPSHWRMVVERVAMRRVEQIVCVSQSVADFVRTRQKLPPTKLLVIPNSVDLEGVRGDMPLDRTPLGIPAERRILLCVGRLHPQKGFDWLLAAAPELFRRLPQHDLVIVGDGPQRQSLGAIAAQQTLENRVHFLGWRPDVPELMRAAEILLLPSRWEGMPNVLLEAMANGLPIVASDVQGVREVLGPAADVQVVVPGNAAVFIDAVCHLATNPEERQRLARENQVRARTEFSLDAMIARYEDLYQEPKS